MRTTRLCVDCKGPVRWWHHPYVRRLDAPGPYHLHRWCAVDWAIVCAGCVRARIFELPEHGCHDARRTVRALLRGDRCTCTCRTLLLRRPRPRGRYRRAHEQW